MVHLLIDNRQFWGLPRVKLVPGAKSEMEGVVGQLSPAEAWGMC